MGLEEKQPEMKESAAIEAVLKSKAKMAIIDKLINVIQQETQAKEKEGKDKS